MLHTFAARVRSSLVVTVAAVACALACAPAAAEAKAALVQLRVEGPSGTLDPGTWYVTGNERVRLGRGHACKNRKGGEKFRGPSALTLAATAARHNKRLSPVRVRPTDFGPQLCQIGSLRSYGAYPDPTGGLLFWINGASGSSSPDLAMLRNGDSVLWHWAEFGTDPEVFTETPLTLRKVPAGTTETTFTVRVLEYDFGGNATPADGATITGAESVVPLGGGRYQVTVARGFSTLQAERGLNVRSEPVEVCSRPKAAKCPKAHGRTIYGSDKGDRLRGTRGWDVIASGKGNDRIDIRKGGRDRVNCGPGKDVVVVKRGDRDDRIGRSCERVIRKG
jgi:hypothetical protein